LRSPVLERVKHAGGCDDRLLWTATRVVDGKTTVSVLSRTVYAFRIPDWAIS